MNDNETKSMGVQQTYNSMPSRVPQFSFSCSFIGNKKVLLRERKRHTARKRAQDADPPPHQLDLTPPPHRLTDLTLPPLAD